MRALDRPWLTGALALLAVLAFKQGYGQADAAHLQWLLAPLAWLLGQASDLDFQRLPGGEWLDTEHGLVIVKACAGGNFLAASWLGYLWRWRGWSLMAALPAAAAAAWLTTLVANGLRILAIAHGQDALAHGTGLSDGDSHRLIGIAVYFACLCVQLAGALPVAVALYLGVALLLPALRSGVLGLGGLDMAHVVWTAGLPLAAWAGHYLWRARPGKMR